LRNDEESGQNNNEPDDPAFPHPHKIETEDKRTTHHKSRHTKYHLSSPTVAWLTLVVQFLGVAVVAVYTYYARKQARAMHDAVVEATKSSGLVKQQLELMRFATRAATDQAEVSLLSLEFANRAWLTTKDFAAPPLDPAGNVNFSIENTGHSPAIGMYLGTFAVLGMEDPLPELTSDQIAHLRQLGKSANASEFVVANGHQFGASVQLVGLQKGHAENITAGRQLLYVYGYIEYEDSFGHPRHTGFRNVWFHDPLTKTWYWKQLSPGKPPD